MSEEHRLYLKKAKIRKLVIRITQFGVLILLLGLWELSAYLEWADPFITSSPSRVAKSIASLYSSGELFTHSFASLWETVVSFLLSTALGTLIAVALWWNDFLRRVTEPYVVVLNSLPKIALGPLIIIWVGAGKAAIITMALMISLIITVISALQGFNSVDSEKIDLLRSMGANKRQIFLKLVLPQNIPNILSILKINVGLSWVGTIMGEYLVSREGLGYLLVYGGQVFRLDLVMASTVILSVLATVMYLAVQLLEKIVSKYF
ncbi:MAG TPA: ABC transporter permease [Candidatus Stercoripulliclostridium merdigallinarum]|uniref:ABC transporter permease n=1 Tax=Candidatus Stercoripulliclostridium merdigallinarum TaxID=2840951 RepID=A0A9D1MHZ5_9FIRM|nr:ABC transporter permease [Candidatus Stercoripulliclostridium merdigallinarum]